MHVSLREWMRIFISWYPEKARKENPRILAFGSFWVVSGWKRRRGGAWKLTRLWAGTDMEGMFYQVV